VIRLHAVLEKVLAVDDHHPGACHLYVNSTESTERPQKAEASAQFLGQSIPGASHMNHMPSHTWNRVGRWGDSVRANLEAWHSDQKAAIGEGFAIYPEHNLHMLLYAASYDGQGAIAIQAAKDYAKLTKDTFYQVLTLVRFGRFDEVAAITTRPVAEVPGAMWDFGQGYAKLRTGDAAGARELAAKVLKTADETKASFRTHAGKNLLGTVGHILEGEIARADKNLDVAIKSFELAVQFEDAMDYDEPEPLPFAARVEHATAADRREHERQLDPLPEHRRREIARLCRNGGTWTEVNVFERARVFAKRDFPIGAAVDVVKGDARQPAFRGEPEIGDVDEAGEIFHARPESIVRSGTTSATCRNAPSWRRDPRRLRPCFSSVLAAPA
jgi:hypothetical protein